MVPPQKPDNSPLIVFEAALQSVLINVARGGVCDQLALADLLSQRRFRAGRAAWVVDLLPRRCGIDHHDEEICWSHDISFGLI